MSEDQNVLSIRYIGKQPRKHDNVTGSAFSWERRGEVVDVPKTVGLVLLRYKDVWVVANTDGDPMKGEPNEGLSDDKLASSLLTPGQSFAMTRVEKIHAAIALIDELDGWDDVIAYREMGEIVQPPVNEIVGSLKTAITAKAGFSNERQEAIAEAIKILDPTNKDHFTDTGVPRVDAINGLLSGIDPVTAPERTEVWDIMQEAEAGRDAA